MNKYYIGTNNNSIFKITDGFEGVFVQLQQGKIGVVEDLSQYDNVPFKEISKAEFDKAMKANDCINLIKYLVA
jgi:hypothetical protein